MNSYTLCAVQSAIGVGEDGDSLENAALRTGVFRFCGSADLAGDGCAWRHDGLIRVPSVTGNWAGCIVLGRTRLCSHQAPTTSVARVLDRARSYFGTNGARKGKEKG